MRSSPGNCMKVSLLMLLPCLMSGDRLVGTCASSSGNKAAVGQSIPRSTVAMNIIIRATQ